MLIILLDSRIYDLTKLKTKTRTTKKMGKQSCEEIWKKCLSVIQDNVSYQNFKMWFKPIVPVSIKENILTIQVPSQFFYEWIERNYITLLKKTIKKELGKEGKLEYHIKILILEK